MKTKRQYLLVDAKKHRRHSAPENLSQWFIFHQGRKTWSERENVSRSSVSDFSVLLENQSESNSSQELDTSNLSRDLSPTPTRKTTPTDSYQNIPSVDFGGDQDEHWHGSGSWVFCFLSLSSKRKNKRIQSKRSSNCRNATQPMWKNIILSQAVAACMAIMDTSTSGLKNNLTHGQNLLHYVLLGVLWTTKLALRNDGRDIIQLVKYSGLRYLFLSVLHVEANYLLLSSFHHDTYLGNQVIDCVAASLCLVIAHVCLEVQFHLIHGFGFTFTVFGAIGLFAANVIHRNQYNEDVLLGDVLRISTGICLAFNSIAQELIVKSIDFVEYMGMIGLIGSVVCGLQAMILETNRMVFRTPTSWLNMASYSAAQFLLNCLSPKILQEIGAPGLHVALTVFEFYSYFFEVISQCEKLHLLYIIPYVVTLAGSILFFMKRTVIGTETFCPVKITVTKES